MYFKKSERQDLGSCPKEMGSFLGFGPVALC